MINLHAICHAVELDRVQAVALEHRDIREAAKASRQLRPLALAAHRGELGEGDLDRRDRLGELADVAVVVRPACRRAAHAISEFPFHPIRASAAKLLAPIGLSVVPS